MRSVILSNSGLSVSASDSDTSMLTARLPLVAVANAVELLEGLDHVVAQLVDGKLLDPLG